MAVSPNHMQTLISPSSSVPRGAFPKFPEFKKYDIKNDHANYARYYEQLEPASDFSPNNIAVWLDINDDLCIAESHHNLILRYSCPFLGNDTVFSIVGTHQPGQTITELFAYQQANGHPQELTMIPEGVVNALSDQDRKMLEIVEDTENFDYVYTVAEKADLSRPEQAKFRRTINRFTRDYGDDTTLKHLGTLSDKEASHLMESLLTWKSGNVVSNNDKLNIERVALERYFNQRKYLRPHVAEVWIAGELAAFALYSYPPQQSYAIINHIKCNYAYRNIFDFIFFCIVSHLQTKGITYANGEQDLGIAGIRDYKHKLGPAAYLKRYTIRPRS
jgi:hypothetical protein